MKKISITSNFLDSKKIVNQNFKFYSLDKAQNLLEFDLKKLPFCFRVLLENLIRRFDNINTKDLDLQNLVNFNYGKEIFFYPSRVLMQDYTGVPAIADLASMRDKLKENGKNPKLVNPVVPVSLVIDHSISVDSSAGKNSINFNVEKEYERNKERYKLLKWAQNSLENFSLFPPGSGICHQINIEYLADIVSEKDNLLFFDSVVGTDSHTTMVNALAVLGWGVGGIEAEAVMLGQPISMQIPEVIGVKLLGKMRDGITAADVVLTITEKLRKLNVVGKFVEFFGPGLRQLSLSERSTISNMAPEYGATCGFFPVDNETIKFQNLTGRDNKKIEIVEAYAKVQGLWHDKAYDQINYKKIQEINLDYIEPCLSGPKRPQDRIRLKDVNKKYFESLADSEKKSFNRSSDLYNLTHGKVCIASITSCTNTSNPSVIIMAGLIAKKAMELGIKIPWWVKTSFAPGSRVVEKYLKKSGLLGPLNYLGFNIVGYGCTTCIGNSGPLDDRVSEIIQEKNLNVCSILSGNRNFEGRIHPLIKSNFLASPPLVVMFAIAGKINIDIVKEEITKVNGKSIFFADLWPKNDEVNEIMSDFLSRELYEKNYKNIFKGDDNWKNLRIRPSETYNWSDSSTYIKRPPFLDLENTRFQDQIIDARPLLILGDSITTDHISPAGVIKEKSDAGKYLNERQVVESDFNSFGSRRGNHEVMVRGTFANIRIKNQMVERDGGYTRHHPSAKDDEVFSVSEEYKAEKVPLIVFAGKEYGTGSSRDWAAKGTKLLGVKVVVAESFERIHRSNLVGMGVLPLQLVNKTLDQLFLDGSEKFDIINLQKIIKKPHANVEMKIKYKNRKEKIVKLLSRIDTIKEITYFKKDGILPYVLDEIVHE